MPKPAATHSCRSPSNTAADGHISYGIRTFDGHCLTAVDGGGRVADVIHTDASQFAERETFTVSSHAIGVYVLRTYDGHYLTSVERGGRDSDAIHSDAARVAEWERFTLVCPPH